IAAGIDGLTGRLLGRHEPGRAEDRSRARQVALLAHRTGQSEIENLHTRWRAVRLLARHRRTTHRAAAFKPNVGGLDVAVDEALLVSGLKAVGDLAADTQDVGLG